MECMTAIPIIGKLKWQGRKFKAILTLQGDSSSKELKGEGRFQE